MGKNHIFLKKTVTRTAPHPSLLDARAHSLARARPRARLALAIRSLVAAYLLTSGAVTRTCAPHRVLGAYKTWSFVQRVTQNASFVWLPPLVVLAHQVPRIAFQALRLTAWAGYIVPRSRSALGLPQATRN